MEGNRRLISEFLTVRGRIKIICQLYLSKPGEGRKGRIMKT